MNCFVYRSSKKEGLYVFLKNPTDLPSLPAPVLKQLGKAEFAMELDLTPNRKLGQEDPAKVIDNINKQGFHLQLPRDIEDVLATIAQKKNAAEKG